MYVLIILFVQIESYNILIEYQKVISKTKKPVIKFYALWSFVYAQYVLITLNHLVIPCEFIGSFSVDPVKNETINMKRVFQRIYA